MARGTVMADGFGRRLKELREGAGMTQEGLARAADVSVSSISKLEQRDLDPSWSTVQALARALGVSTEAFKVEGGEPEPEPEKPARKRKGK